MAENEIDLFNGEIFEIVEEFDDGKITAKCKLCPQSNPKFYSGHRKISSNFLTHLKRKHKDVEKEYQAAKKPKNTQSILNFAVPQPSKNAQFKRCSQNEAKKSITNFVVKSGIPITLVEKEPFKNLVSTLSGGACHSITCKTLKKCTEDDFIELQTKINKSVSRHRIVSLRF